MTRNWYPLDYEYNEYNLEGYKVERTTRPRHDNPERQRERQIDNLKDNKREGPHSVGISEHY